MAKAAAVKSLPARSGGTTSPLLLEVRQRLARWPWESLTPMGPGSCGQVGGECVS